VTGTTGNTANLSWTASTDNVGVNGYKVYRNGTLVSTTSTTTFFDSGLAPNTTYSYTVSAYDFAGNESAQSTTVNGTTAGPDTTAPSMPTGLVATPVSTSEIDLSWVAATDNVGVTGYKVYRNGSAVGTTTGALTFKDTGLTAATSYSYTVGAVDAAGNESAQSTAVNSSTQAPDTTPPTVPTGLTVTNVTSTTASLSWAASTDNVGVSSYKVYRNGSLVTAVGTTSFNDTGLAPGTTYTYTVSAYDAMNNESAQSAPVGATTTAPDTTPPSVPTGLTVTGTTNSTVSLSWTTSTDNTGVTGYQVFRSGGLVGTTTATTFTDNGLLPITSYTYTVAAYDAAGNISAQSTAVNATTGAATVTNPTFVQLNSTTPQTAQTSVPVAFTQAQTAGNLNIVVVGFYSSTGTVSSVTDSAGNTYVLAAPLTRQNATSQAIYYAKNIKAAAAGTNTVTVTFSVSVPYPDIRIAEYAGLDTVSPFDATSSGAGFPTTATSGNVTTTKPVELLFGAGDTAGMFSAAGSGYTLRVITTPDGDIVEDRVVTSTGTYAATATNSSDEVMQIVAFKAAGQ
jgi:chitodextrinase